MTHFLDTLLFPESVAVVGATNDRNRLSYNIFANLVRLKFPGRIYPVNPNTPEILGIKTYPNLTSIREPVDLVVIAIPAAKTLPVIRECIAKKVKGIVLVSGGFSETGEAGRRTQDEILRMLQESGIRAIGPNALSPINSANNLIVSFYNPEDLNPGKVSFIFQSGLYEPRLHWLTSEFGLHLNKVIDLGNKMDINEVDALEYLAQDASTEVIAIHMESIVGDARKFMRLLKETTKHKPVVVMKSGRTADGARAASSHTGAIMKSSDTVIDVMLKQCGAIRAQSLDDFFDWAKVFDYYRHMELKGNRIAVASGSGGEGVTVVDAAQLNGFTLGQVSPQTYEKMRPVFPAWEITPNPFDIGVSFQFHGAIETYSTLFNAMSDEDNVDCLAAHLIARAPEADRFLEPALRLLARGKLLVLWTSVPQRQSSVMVQHLQSHGIPVYPSGERAVKALAALRKWKGKHTGEAR